MSKKKTLINELKIAWVDTETTGLYSSKHEIIEMAAIIYDPQSDEVLREWERKAAPRNIKTASSEALKINGYAKNKHAYSDSIEDVIQEFNEITSGCIIAGQNIEFDIGFIRKYYREFGIKKQIHRHRKLELVSMVWPAIYDTKLDSLSLSALCDYFEISNDNAHRALTDCRRTLEVYRCAMKILRN